MTETLKNIALILASLSVGWGAFKWQYEFVGKRRIELAENVLALFYEVRDALRAVRSRSSYGGEGESRKPGEIESSEEKHIRNQAYIVIERLQKHKELFGRIHALRFRYMALFGKENGKPFDELDRIFNNIVRSTEEWADYKISAKGIPPGDERRLIGEDIKRVGAVVWFSPDNDPITAQVDELIQAIESQCRPMIQRYYQPIAIPGLNWVRKRWPKIFGPAGQ